MLEITEDGKTLLKGYSPFTAEKHVVNQPETAPPSEVSQQESPAQNE